MEWNPEWEVEKTVGPKKLLLSYLGDALSCFLKLQVNPETAKKPASVQEHLQEIDPRILLTKTPSVKGLDNFFSLFPNAYLLIIVRDGRAVVESGVKSFDWYYEKAMRNWATAAKIIVDFQEKHHNFNKKFLIVKYEDLFRNTKDELLKIFALLGLDAELYDFGAAQSLSVTGSSELRRKRSDKIHWTPLEKTREFNPLTRFSHWNRKRHERFNWIAGYYMSKFGYSLETNCSHRYLYFARNTLLDLIYKIGVVLIKVAIRIAKRAREILLTRRST